MQTIHTQRSHIPDIQACHTYRSSVIHTHVIHTHTGHTHGLYIHTQASYTHTYVCHTYTQDNNTSSPYIYLYRQRPYMKTRTTRTHTSYIHVICACHTYTQSIHTDHRSYTHTSYIHIHTHTYTGHTYITPAFGALLWHVYTLTAKSKCMKVRNITLGDSSYMCQAIVPTYKQCTVKHTYEYT